jgi:hypothetical protein
MLFNLNPDTECELTTFVGRTQKSGPDDVPAVTFRLQLSSVQNTLLDLFSSTMRHTVYAPVEGQEQLPGVEVTTPILRSKDLKHWAPETRLEGWTVIIARGITDDSALQMGTCKIDDFKFDFFDGGHMDVDFRISTADVDEDGAGMLWGRQKRKVFATITAPEMPAKPIDGTTAAFERDHPDATDLFANGDGSSEPPPQSVTHEPPGPDDDEGSEGGDPDAAPAASAGKRTARGNAKTRKAIAEGLAAAGVQ